MVKTDTMANLIKFRKIKEDYDNGLNIVSTICSRDNVVASDIIRDRYNCNIFKSVILSASRRQKIVDLTLLLVKEQVEEDLKLAEDEFKKDLLDNVQL
jgi:hypothetical protein